LKYRSSILTPAVSGVRIAFAHFSDSLLDEAAEPNPATEDRVGRERVHPIAELFRFHGLLMAAFRALTT